MDLFLRIIAGVLITAILSLVLSKHSSDISLLLTIAVCCIVVLAACSYLQPVLSLARKLVEIGQLDTGLLSVLLKVTGIGLISQIAGFICADAGKQTLEKAVQIVATAAILCISVPAIEEMISLIDRVLGEL